MSRRPPRPCEPGDRITVRAGHWVLLVPDGVTVWTEHGEPFELVVESVAWDSWLDGGCWAVTPTDRTRVGRLAASRIHAVDRTDGVQALF